MLGRPPPGMPALGMPKPGGFPQVCADCAACGCFWLNDSEEVRLDKHAMDDGPVPVGGRTRRPAEVGGASVGGLMASLDSYHLDLVVAVLWHAGSGGPTRHSANDSAGQWL